MSANPIAALLGDSTFWPNASFPAGTPLEIDYAFAATAPADWPYAGFAALDGARAHEDAASYRELIQDSFAAFEHVCGVRFVETDAAQALLVFGLADFPSAAGITALEYSYELGLYRRYVAYENDLFAYGNAATAISHEIGHALGLKHPGAYSANDSGPFLPAGEDNTANTVMSYSFAGTDTVEMRPYDVAALQYIYGPSVAGNDVRFGIASGVRDRSGNADDELFALDGYSTWRYANTTSFTNSGSGYRASENWLTIDGGGGVDQVYVPRPFGETRIERAADGSVAIATDWQVALQGGLSGILTFNDRLVAIERLRFEDADVALDIDGHAGDAYRLLFAALGAAPPAELLGQWIEAFDAGRQMDEVATAIIDAYAPAIGSRELVTLLYGNIAGAPPDAQTLEHYSELAESGAMNRGELYAFAAATPLNTANAAALMGDFLFYLP
jgi:hypothetical protein